jgi:hypothetical protein
VVLRRTLLGLPARHGGDVKKERNYSTSGEKRRMNDSSTINLKDLVVAVWRGSGWSTFLLQKKSSRRGEERV